MFQAAASIYNGTNMFGLGVANTIVGYNQNKENQEMQLKINRENAALARELNEKNRQYELEDQAYLAQREDTALRRKAAELEALGINPIMAGLAGGQGAQSGMIGARNTSNMIAGEAPISTNPLDIGTFSKASEALNNIGDPLERKLERERQKAEIENIEADTRAKESGKKGTDLDNTKKEIELEYAQDKAIQDLKKQINENTNLEQALKTAIREYDYMFNAEERAKAEHIMNQQLKMQEKIINEYQQQINQAKDERERQELEQEMKEFKVNTGIKIIDSIGNFAAEGLDFYLRWKERIENNKNKGNRYNNGRRNP